MKYYSLITYTVACSFIVGALAGTIKPNHEDGSSYGNIDEVATRHLFLDFEVNFDKRQFQGQVEHTMTVLKDNVTSAIFDYVGLDISDVAFQPLPQGLEAPVEYKLHTDLNKNLGNALEVILPAERALAVGDRFKIVILYSTNNQTTAINWLSPSQTAGKKMPYLFTQCETIACRSVAPMQDTPANKLTYEAKVTVPSPFVVKMSANDTKVEHLPETNQIVYYFEN